PPVGCCVLSLHDALPILSDRPQTVLSRPAASLRFRGRSPSFDRRFPDPMVVSVALASKPLVVECGALNSRPNCGKRRWDCEKPQDRKSTRLNSNHVKMSY